MRKLHLICNAHLDPVWLWTWEEGLAETLSTFRTAARLCEDYQGFAFCHNEALLYQWVENYEPELFEKIRTLVQKGQWHIMGGWYLQPDCNLPAGESLVRQILIGKNYFLDKFAVEPRTAINFDSFGHTRGLVQILKKAGYTSYLFCRPETPVFDPAESQFHWVPIEDFIWVGYDGSEILAHHVPDHYNAPVGKAAAKVKGYLDRNNRRQTGILLWGIGDHGGGPSRLDLENIEQLRSQTTDWEICHGRPEDYFAWLEQNQATLPCLSQDLNPFAVGCYTSMAQVKQKHRELENNYFRTEKMLAQAALQGFIAYPRAELQTALEDLLYCEFHDILPGDGIAEVENEALRRLNHGLEIVNQLSTGAFFRLLAGQPPAAEGEYPLFVYNPHPYDLDEIVVLEFQPVEPNFNWSVFWQPVIRDETGRKIELQLEKKSCNIQVEQRKRLVFKTRLKAATMNRFSCVLEEIPLAMKQGPGKSNVEKMLFRSESCQVVIGTNTGLIESYQVNGVEFCRTDTCRLLVINDDQDPWGMRVRSFRQVVGHFTLMTEEESAVFAGVAARKLPPVRIIEDGPVRTTVEALFKYNQSAACVQYKIPKIGAEIEVALRIYWLEKDKMLKLSIPTVFNDGNCSGQVAYGVESFGRPGEELVAQKWLAIAAADQPQALTIINDSTYGFDFQDGEARLSLLRSPAFAGHPVAEHIPIVAQDRFEPRIDQGERNFRFWLQGGPAAERTATVQLEAMVKNEPPLALCYNPPGTGRQLVSAIRITPATVLMTALKMAEKQDWLIIRLFEASGRPVTATVTIPFLTLQFDLALAPFDIKTIAVARPSNAYFEVDLLERK